MHILITGVTGFIGSYLGDRMLSRGHEVTGISRQSDPNLAFKNNSCFELVTADLCTDNLSDVLPDSVDMVYHYAAQISDSMGFRGYLHNNVLATYKIFDYSKNNAKKFVQASTGSVYGWDGDKMVIDENTPERPYTNYGLTKYLADVIIRTQGYHHDISTCILRYPVVYGYEESNEFIENIYHLAKANEDIHIPSNIAHRKLDFIHIEDVIDANMAVLNQSADNIEDELFLIGSGQSIEMINMVESIIEDLNSDSELIVDDVDEQKPPDIYWDVSKSINYLQLNSTDKHGI